MTIESVLKLVVEQLEKSGIRYALAGGIVASIYRSERRVTADIDVAIVSEKDETQQALEIIKSIGLKPSVITSAQLEGGPVWAIRRKSSPDCIVVGRDPNNRDSVGVDLLLPNLRWVAEAVRRAQNHQLDLGFGRIPCLTIEDLIIAKLDALQDKANRFKDLDDLQSIFLAKHKLDLSYLVGKLQEYELPLPEILFDSADYLLVRASKKIDRKLKNKNRLKNQ